MGILSWIIFGLIAGAIAKFILPGRDPGGIFVTIMIGIVGGVLGGWLGSALTGGMGVWRVQLHELCVGGGEIADSSGHLSFGLSQRN